MEFDYIVIGAGAAGCAMAARLSENPTVQVLLLEAGGSDASPIITMPAALPFAYQSRKLGWGYLSGPEPHLGGREIDEKRGKVVGGSTSINAMIYNRGNPLDFDGWAELGGLPEWDYAHCLPYFRMMERFADGANTWRGGDGPMHIVRCAAQHPLHQAFLRAGEQAGHALTEDHNAYRQEGLHVAQAYIRKGERCSSARGYLRDALARPNLHLWRHAHVLRLLHTAQRINGVQLQRLDRIETAHAAREVVLCAGAFNTPQLLMLSGIGPADHLRQLSIEVLADVPAVGQNLENHPGVNIQYATRRRGDSLVSELGAVGRLRLGLQWLLLRRGLGASNFFETGAFLRTREDVAFPNVQFEFLPLARYIHNGKLMARAGFQFWLDLSRPQSRGFVQLRSANPHDAPRIVFNHLQARQDMADLVDAVRLARTLIAQSAFDAVRGEELTPGPHVRSDADIEAFIRQNLGSSYHPSGTCRMGADAGAVVDGQGRLKAMEGLRIVDASIMPRTVTANLSASILMMAEKIADAMRGRQLAPLQADFFRQP